MTAVAQHNHLQPLTTPAEAALPCQSLPFVGPGAGEAAGIPTSTTLSLQPSPDSNRANNGAPGHRQGERKDTAIRAACGTDAASWTGKLPGRGTPACTPAALPDSFPLRPTNWHILICKSRFGAGGHRWRNRNLCDECQPSHLHKGPKRQAVGGMHLWERAASARKAQRLWPNAKASSDWLPGTLYQLAHNYTANSSSDDTCAQEGASLGDATQIILI